MAKYSFVNAAIPPLSKTTVKTLFKFLKQQGVNDYKGFVIELIYASTSFVGERYNIELKNGAGEANKKIWAVHANAIEMADILSNEPDVMLELDRMVQRHLGEMITAGKLLPDDIPTYRDAHFKQLLLYLGIIAGATDNRKPTLGKGRPKRKEAHYHFYKCLYCLCEDHGVTPKKNTRFDKGKYYENSILHKIRNIIGSDLGLGITEHDRVINNVIKECQEQKKT